MTIIFDEQIANAIANQHRDASVALAAIINSGAMLHGAFADSVSFADFDLRQALKGDKRAIASVSQGVDHTAWTEFFSAHDAHHLLLNRERRVQHGYMFADSYRRSFYNDIKTLTPYTVGSAREFFDAHLSLTPARAAEWLNCLLERTGKDYRSHCTQFKTKMSVRSMDSYGNTAHEFARAVYVMAALTGVPFTFDSLYTELRNNRTIDGTAFDVCNGLGVTLEWHANGNATLRLSKELVNSLNAAIGAK